MTYREFISVFNGLSFIEREQFENAIGNNKKRRPGDFSYRYAAFCQNPAYWLSRQPDDVAERVFQLVQQGERS